jgi:hypothetical protein
VEFVYLAEDLPFEGIADEELFYLAIHTIIIAPESNFPARLETPCD